MSKNIVNNIPEARAYFENIVASHPEIKDFIFGDPDVLSADTRSKINYPALWLESPEISLGFAPNFKKGIQCSISIIDNTPADHWDRRYNELLGSTEKILRDVILWMKEDSEKGFIKLDQKNIKLDPIFPSFSDHVVGYRTTFPLRAMESHVFETAHRQDLCPVGTLPKFKWENTTDGEFTSLEITNNTLPVGEGFTWEWKYQIDEGNIQTATTEDLSINTAGNRAYIQLTTTKGSCVRYASVKLTNEKNAGLSVPYLLKSKL